MKIVFVFELCCRFLIWKVGGNWEFLKFFCCIIWSLGGLVLGDLLFLWFVFLLIGVSWLLVDCIEVNEYLFKDGVFEFECELMEWFLDWGVESVFLGNFIEKVYGLGEEFLEMIDGIEYGLGFKWDYIG